VKRWMWAMLLVGCVINWGAGQSPETEVYRLAPGDLITITVLGEPLLSGDQLIGPDGTIRLPLIGTVRAAGLTLDELTERLTQSLRRFLRDPKVVIALKQLPPLFRRVYVLGAVKMPGSYALPVGGAATVIDAIALAGGFSEDADMERVRVFQKDGRVMTINLKNFQADGFRGNGMTLQPGDLVWVPPAFVRVSVAGAVNLPGFHPVPTQTTLLDVLARAGGVKDPSAVIKVYRNGMEILSVPWLKLSEGAVVPIALQEGDTVIAAVKEVAGVIVTGAGVQRPGMFNLVGRVTVLGALSMAGVIADSRRPLRVRLLRENKEIAQVQWNSATPAQELLMELQSGDILVVDPMVIKATIVGPVQKPGSYELPAGARVTDLLAKAEGFQPTADLSNVTLVRKEGSRSIDLLQLFLEAKLENDVELQDGDVLLVPAARKVWVVGAVQRPGAIDFQPRLSVIDAISAAGGVRNLDEADLSAVRLVSGEETRVLNLESAFKGATIPLLPVKPGDVIIVPERAKAYVFGAVARPGAVRVKGDDNALTAISEAGGPIPDARLDRAVMVRLVDGKPIVMQLNLEKAIKNGDLSQAPALQAGDVLYIPSRRRENWDFPRVVGVITALATAAYYLRVR
jgi:protein involved in polysaccharide export with SLBB domain